MSTEPFYGHDREAAQSVVLRFFDLVDHGRAAETAALFTLGATITFGPGSPQPGTVTGDKIPEAMAARQQLANVTTRHVLSNMILSLTEDGFVICRSLLTLYRSDDKTLGPIPRTIADVEDKLVRDGTGWLIEARTITPIFGLA